MINLKIARIRLGMTQTTLADKVGVNSNDISRYETGRMKPTLDNLVKLANVLGVSTDYLLERE